VAAESGEPLPGVRLSTPGDASGILAVERRENGTHRVDRLPPGPLELAVDAPGRAALRLSAQVRPGGWTDLGTVELERACSLNVSVVGPDGAPRQAEL
jgi:hypothetical protein